MQRHSFLDDYSDGCHAQILTALSATNMTQQTAYGEDEYCIEARQLIQARLGGVEADVHFVASGTLANIISIASALRPHEAVIAAVSGHIAMRETGAIEATGDPILPGRITVFPHDLIHLLLIRFIGCVHGFGPIVEVNPVSISGGPVVVQPGNDDTTPDGPM